MALTLTSVATDSFTDSDNTNLEAHGGGNWGLLISAAAGYTGIVSNALRPKFNNTIRSVHRWAGAGTFSDDQYSQISIVSIGGDSSSKETGLVVRASADTNGAADYYEWYFVGNTPRTTVLRKVVNGTATSLDSTTAVAWADGDVMALAVVGTTIYGLRNGAVVVTVTGQFDLTTGRPGIAMRGLTGGSIGPVLDSWAGGTAAEDVALNFSGTVGSQGGTVGTAFSWSGSALSGFFGGGTTPYAYSVFSGTLPAGLTLNSSTGVVSGTPTTAGSTTIVFRATDAASATANGNSVTFTIAAAAATATTLIGPSGGQVGVASSNFTVGANGTITGTVTVTPSAVGGGTFSPTSVAISAGSPTATFTYTPGSAGSKTISISDDGGLTDAASLSYAASSAPATLVVPGLTSWTGTAQAALTVPNVVVVQRSNRTLTLALTNQTTDGSGGLTITSGALAAGIGYMVLGFSDDGALSFRRAVTAA